MTHGRFFLLRNKSGVDLFKFLAVNLFAHQQLAVAAGFDFHLLQHLAHDHFDMLVVDLHALQPVDLLDLLHQIGGKGFDAHHRQNIMRRRMPIQQVFALLDEVALLDRNMLALGHQILGGLYFIVFRTNDDAALVLVIAAKLHNAVNFGNNGVVLGPAGLEQFSHTRQTTGDIAGLGGLARDAGQHIAGMHRRAVLDRENGIHTEQIARLGTGRQRNDLAFLVAQGNARLQIDTLRH